MRLLRVPYKNRHAPTNRPGVHPKSQYNPRAPHRRQAWPQCRRVVSEKQVAEAILAQFEQVPRDWQLEAGLQMLRDEDLMLVARTAAGKSMVFKVAAMAARLAGLHGCVIMICPLKEVEKDHAMKSLERSSADAVRGEEHAHDELEGVRAVVTGVE
jgi:superfamily II DNA or RNA helicase